MNKKNTLMKSPIVNAALLPDMNRRDLLKGAGLTLAVLGAGSLLTACADKARRRQRRHARRRAFPAHRRRQHRHRHLAQHRMGQGAYTGLATLVAEELDADWSQVVIEAAPADVKLYGNPAFGGALQGTGGSTTVAAFWEPMRKAGATARAMLVAAAAQDWGVPAGEITVSKRRGQPCRQEASARPSASWSARPRSCPCPQEVTLKDPKDFVLIGKDTPARRRARQVQRHRDLHAGHQAAGHAGRRGHLSAALRRQR